MPPRYLITVAERQFRVHELASAPGQSSPTVRQIESLEFVPAKGSYTDRDTDQAGRFPHTANRPGMSIDERLPMQEEQHRRAVDWLAEQIETFVSTHADAPWAFAAGATLHNPVLEKLRPSVRATLSESVRKDLIHTPAPELPSHFPVAVA